MKATLSKNYKFIQLSEKPQRAETGGFKIYHKFETATELPISYTNLIAGKIRYYLNMLPKELRESIYKLEIRQGEEWLDIPILTPHLHNK